MTEAVLLIFGMALVTAIPRILPLLLLSGRQLPPVVARWLSFIPPAVLSALLLPELLLLDQGNGPALAFGRDNAFLLATVPAALTCLLTRSFFATVAVGMGSVAAMRYLL